MRELYSRHLAAVTGALILLAAVVFAVVQSPEVWELSAGTAASQAQEVSHPIEGRERCGACHGPQGVKPYPVRHLGWSTASCTRCHAPGPAPSAPPPASPGAAAPLPHPLEGYESCGDCHGPEGVFPFPDDHRGFSDRGCTACHPASGT
ncbi:MAG: hypothetical protein SCH98_15700 [Deferrisomatales bacterium]|nr:hypothetical protein [Deferrisomatales bacterium]